PVCLQCLRRSLRPGSPQLRAVPAARHAFLVLAGMVAARAIGQALTGIRGDQRAGGVFALLRPAVGCGAWARSEVDPSASDRKRLICRTSPKSVVGHRPGSAAPADLHRENRGGTDSLDPTSRAGKHPEIYGTSVWQ